MKQLGKLKTENYVDLANDMLNDLNHLNTKWVLRCTIYKVS